MTAGDPKGIVSASRVSKEARKAMAHGLESLSCIVPKSYHREVDDAATENNATVFPLKESYRKNIQHPYSQKYWDDSAKDYRHALLNEIAEEEEEMKGNVQATLPKIRRIPDIPSRSYPHLNSQVNVSEFIDLDACQEHWKKETEIHENVLRDELEHFQTRHNNENVWETDLWEDRYHPHRDVHYNAILNVQEDEDRRINSETHQSQASFAIGGDDAQLRNDVINQEYLRLKAISEKHERKNAITKSRMNVPRNETHKMGNVFRQPLTYDGRQGLVESNLHPKADPVFDSRYSSDPFSVSNLSSPTFVHEEDKTLSTSSTMSSRGRGGLLESTPSNTHEPLQKAASFENSSKSVREDGFMSKITVVESQHSLDPIFVSSASSPLESSKEEKGFSATTTASSRGNDVILENKRITQGGQPQRFASFDRHRGATTHEHVRRSASLDRLHRANVRNRLRSEEGSAMDSQSDFDPTFESEFSPPTMSWPKERELAAESTRSFREAMKEQEKNHDSTRYGSSHIELNRPDVVSELSYTPGASIRPITPSPTASGNHQQQFEIPREQDVRCDKGRNLQFFDANPYIPAYSDSVIIGRPISPENIKGYDNQEHGSIDGLSPVTCSGSQFRNRIYANNARQVREDWGDESVNREPIEKSNETIKVQHLSSKREDTPTFFRPPPSSQTCMPLFNKKVRSVVGRYHQKLKESAKR